MNPDLNVTLALAGITLITLTVWLPVTIRRELNREARREAMRRHPAGKAREFDAWAHHWNRPVPPCPHGPDCDPSVEVLDPYTTGPDGPTGLVCLTHDQTPVKENTQ